MAGGGKREGAGRKAGVPNKANAKLRAEIAASGLTPLEYMLRVMRDVDADAERRDRMAAAAAPFCHARLSAVEAKITHRDEMTEDELRKSIAEDLVELGIADVVTIEQLIAGDESVARSEQTPAHSSGLRSTDPPPHGR